MTLIMYTFELFPRIWAYSLKSNFRWHIRRINDTMNWKIKIIVSIAQITFD